MATITLAITPAAKISAWESPAAEYVNTGIWPSSKIVFGRNSSTVAVKDAANETHVIFTLTLPPNFYYRMSIINIAMVSSAIVTFEPGTGFEQYMQGVVTMNGDTQYRFTVKNNLLAAVIQPNAMKIAPDSVANDFGATYSPVEQVGDFLIDAADQEAIVTINWMDTSDDATAAAQILSRFEFMQYTIEQALAAPINTPTLIY